MPRQVDVGATTLREANGERVEGLDQAHSIRVRMIRRERGQAASMLPPVIRHEHAGILAAKIRSERAQPDCGMVSGYKQEGRV
jgi:hypothetical protein